MKHWQVREAPPQSFLDAFPELPDTALSLLYHRDIRTQEAIDEFLNPEYSKDVHDPFLFRDMEKAVTRVLTAIEKQEKIVIHGDYDADGVSAATVLATTLKKLGAQHVDAFLPHRETDGYGLNMNTVELLANEGNTLMITCDCGVSNKDEIARANELSLDVIVTDHHAIPPELPPALAIIHPKVPGEDYPGKHLCGAAVAFKLAQAVLRTHKKDHDTLSDGTPHEAFEKWLLDMVAIASVADMVPLIGESRTLTKYGLLVLNKTRRIGLQKLLLEARIRHDDGTSKHIDADTIGFRIAPMINAAGRLNHANVAYNLMVTEDPIAATDLAFELKSNNQARQKLTETYVKEAMEQVEDHQKDAPVLVVKHRDWTTGIVGLIASRLKAHYHKPTIALAWNNGDVTGSGRSIAGFNLIEAIQEIPEFFTKSGGHPMACGFTLTSEDVIDGFREALLKKYAEKTAGKEMGKRLDIDAIVSLDDVNWDLYAVLEKFAPFGKENPKPLYLAKGLTIKKIKPVGKDGRHLTLMVMHHSPKIRKMIGWSLCSKNGKTNWCEQLKEGDVVDVVFEIGVNEWNGNREIQMTISDLQKAS